MVILWADMPVLWTDVSDLLIYQFCKLLLRAGEALDSKQRRLNMIKAVEGDDWSAVIDSQTQQTIEGTHLSIRACCIPTAPAYTHSFVSQCIAASSVWLVNSRSNQPCAEGAVEASLVSLLQFCNLSLGVNAARVYCSLHYTTHQIWLHDINSLFEEQCPGSQ